MKKPPYRAIFSTKTFLFFFEIDPFVYSIKRFKNN